MSTVINLWKCHVTFTCVSNRDYLYILFVGVEAGNTIVEFRNSAERKVTKLIHLSADEIYYEPNFYAIIGSDEFAVYEEGLLSKCKSIVNVNPKEIEPWSYKAKVSKESLNKVNVKNMIYPLGTRKYYEFKHLEESIFCLPELNFIFVEFDVSV